MGHIVLVFAPPSPSRLPMLFYPDFSWVTLICGSFARIWTFLRTDPILQTLRNPQASKTLVEGRIEPREILSLTLVFDHDLIDGAPAARFARGLVELIVSGYGRDEEQTRTAMDAEPVARVRTPDGLPVENLQTRNCHIMPAIINNQYAIPECSGR
jgi:2-oxoacid dehydrogenases acyltransferase (catalytic domain)